MSETAETRFDDEFADGPSVDADAAAIRRMDAAATVLDDGLELPGTDFRVGLDPVIGILPVAGDLAVTVVSLFIPLQAALLGVRRRTLARMFLNIAIDLVGGSIPLVGDLFDAFWKANRRNVDLALRDLDVDPA